MIRNEQGMTHQDYEALMKRTKEEYLPVIAKLSSELNELKAQVIQLRTESPAFVTLHNQLSSALSSFHEIDRPYEDNECAACKQSEEIARDAIKEIEEFGLKSAKHYDTLYKKKKQ